MQSASASGLRSAGDVAASLCHEVGKSEAVRLIGMCNADQHCRLLNSQHLQQNLTFLNPEVCSVRVGTEAGSEGRSEARLKARALQFLNSSSDLVCGGCL
jgi:hypothetical protein